MFPVLVQLGGFKLATYGALAAAGYLAAILWLGTQRARMGLAEDRFWGLVTFLFIGALAGGKLLYVGVEWRAFASGELDLLRDFRYGFVFFGGVAGAALMGVVYCLKTGESFMRLSDPFGVALPMGHAIGRLGCLAAGCCHGKPTALPWGLAFSHPMALVAEGLHGRPLHPTQALEAAGCAALAASMLPVLRRVQAGRLREGTAFLAYLLGYSAMRFGIEFLRGDDRGGSQLGLSPSQWIAAASAGAAAVAMAVRGLAPKGRQASFPS